MWIDVEEKLPDDSLSDVLVTDGEGCYAVAYYSRGHKKWRVSDELLSADSIIELNHPVKYWKPIEKLNLGK